MSIFYGPVLSRRFGYSLGVDIIPYKICSYDCTYCQLGKTTTKTINRKSYVKINLEEFKYSLCSIIDKNERIDYITFSGSGEPTLNKNIGTLIKQVKSITDIPVAVLTNGSLLNKKGVIDDIKKAELIKELDIEITGNKDKSLTNNIIELARRRPVTSRDISKSLIVNTNEVIKYLKPLLEQEKIKFKVHNNERFYYK